MENSKEILPKVYRKKNTGLELTFTQATDSHFVDIHIVRLKTGSVTRSHYVLLSDLAVWLQMFEDDAWKLYEHE